MWQFGESRWFCFQDLRWSWLLQYSIPGFVPLCAGVMSLNKVHSVNDLHCHHFSNHQKKKGHEWMNAQGHIIIVIICDLSSLSVQLLCIIRNMKLCGISIYNLCHLFCNYILKYFVCPPATNLKKKTTTTTYQHIEALVQSC